MKGKRIKQINNLVIFQDTAEKIRVFDDIKDNPSFGKCSVWAPDGRCLEEQLTLEQAEDFCRRTFDEVSTEVLKKMAKEAFSLYYAEATKPCGGLQQDMDFTKLQEATVRLNAINDELERRIAEKAAGKKSPLDHLLSVAEQKRSSADLKASEKAQEPEFEL